VNASQIFLNIFFGIIGMGYCYSGKRHSNGRLFICGLILGIFPYLVSGTVWLILIGIVVTGFPLVFRGD